MKKLLLTIPLFLILPLSAFASVSYSRSPSGLNITSPVSIYIHFDTYNDLGFSDLSQYYFIELNSTIPENPNLDSDCFPISENTKNIIFDIPMGRSFDSVFVFGATNSECSDFTGDSNEIETSGSGADLFTIISPPSGGGVLFGRHYAESGSDDIGTSTTDLMAAVGFVSSDTFGGIFPYLMLSVGVFISFYIIQAIAITMGRMSGEKVNTKKAAWSGEGLMKHEYTHWRKKARSRKKRGLDIE